MLSVRKGCQDEGTKGKEFSPKAYPCSQEENNVMFTDQNDCGIPDILRTDDDS